MSKESSTVVVFLLASVLLSFSFEGLAEAGFCKAQSPLNACQPCKREADCGGTDHTSYCWNELSSACNGDSSSWGVSPPEYETLLYQIGICTRDQIDEGDCDPKSREITRDGSNLMLVFKSEQSTNEFSVCVKYDYYDSDFDSISRYGCFEWFDTSWHSVELLSASEADRIKKFVLHNYDVYGAPAWDGSGKPPGIVTFSNDYRADQSSTYVFSGNESAKKGDRLGSSYADSSDANSEAKIRKKVKKAIELGAKGLLFCAHPTGKYKSVDLDEISISTDGVGAEFTIYYQCTVIERPCNMTFRVAWAGGKRVSLKVLSDTAFTPAEAGLDFCKSLITGDW